ncbi:hypothetical protein L484_008449 [Morus notabilis]|uniref:Uncharacterized protein n=1 Tax=Morus notabilis TaxID=981085 RepID=W9SEP5_9ROSA|nr:hypothetical protein L484_008449 [Morus notabilis]
MGSNRNFLQSLTTPVHVAIANLKWCYCFAKSLEDSSSYPQRQDFRLEGLSRSATNSSRFAVVDGSSVLNASGLVKRLCESSILFVSPFCRRLAVQLFGCLCPASRLVVWLTERLSDELSDWQRFWSLFIKSTGGKMSEIYSQREVEHEIYDNRRLKWVNRHSNGGVLNAGGLVKWLCDAPPFYRQLVIQLSGRYASGCSADQMSLLASPLISSDSGAFCHIYMS